MAAPSSPSAASSMWRPWAVPGRRGRDHRCPGVGRIEIDGRGIDFVDSTGLGALLMSRTDAQLAGVSWFIGPASVSLRRMLDLAGLGGMLADPAVN